MSCAPEWMVNAYIVLADPYGSNFGLDEAARLRMLCDFRDRIAELEGRTPEEVQDDYGQRAARMRFAVSA